MQRERGVSRNCCVAGHGHSNFGAKGNGQTDDTGAIQKAIGAAKESGPKLYFPKGDYQITQTIQINAHGLQMEGAGPDHTRIIAAAEMDRMCYLLGSNVVIPHMSTDCNASVIRSCRTRGNEGRGLTITSTDYSGGCTVLDCNVETHPSNRSAGAEYVLVTAAHGMPVVIKRRWAEGRRNNLYDAIRITSPSVMLAESRISLGGDSSVRARHSIHLASDTLVHLEQTRGDFRPGGKIRAEPSGATAIVSFWQALPSWSDARGSIKSTSITIARNCVIKNNWLAREQAESPPPRIHVDANLTNHIGKNYSPWNAELIPVIEE